MVCRYATAYQYFEKLSQTEPKAYFAMGWLKANIDSQMTLADKAHQKLSKKLKF